VSPFSINLTHSDELNNFLTAENYVPSSCVMHTRNALERVGFRPEDVPRIADWRCWRGAEVAPKMLTEQRLYVRLIIDHEYEQIHARPPDLLADAAARCRTILNSVNSLLGVFRLR